jgi:hypothetical protein
LKLRLDEMYPPSLARALARAGIEAVTAAQIGLAGRSDYDVFATAVADGRVLLTENVADFARIAGDHLAAGHRCPGVLIALSTRFSRRPAGHGALVAAIRAVTHDPLDDRVLYLQRVGTSRQ